MAFHWYTMRVKPHKERSVYELLIAEDVEVYLPLVKVNPKNPRAAKYRPYFPGYMFIHCDLASVGRNRFQWIPGTHGLVNFDGDPPIVPADLIDELENRLIAIERSGGLVLNQIEPGDRVRITKGPFTGFTGIFNAHLSGRERVEVLLAFLSQSPHRVQMDVADVDKIG